MADIVLATLNAKYFHASLGLRYLYANLGELQPRAEIAEFITSQRPVDIAEQLLARQPRVIGLGVYVWNVAETTELVAILKAVAPDLVVVLGGPEVSHETDQQPLTALADHVITGQADLAFAQLCRRLLAGEPAGPRIQHAGDLALADLELPYAFYTDTDIANRLIYVEASRGCPFKCQFCLSALDKTAVPFDLDRFLAAMADLHARGVRHFKFVDRTFNLNPKTATRILQFFLDRLDDRLFLHFELVPDRLPPAVAALLQQFPAGVVQLEIGVQTFDPEVQARIDRVQDTEQTETNLRWLRNQTHAHLHVDLILGLPGETWESIGVGFDRLIALGPQEIQVGVLKRLRGAPIIAHTAAFDLRFDPAPPYTVLQTSTLTFDQLQRLNRFARYWDVIGNSGRFAVTRPLVLGDQPFDRFMALSDWLFATTQQTHTIALDRLFGLLLRGLTEALAVPQDVARQALAEDHARSGARGTPGFLLPPGAPQPRQRIRAPHATRQDQHQRGTGH